MVDFSDRIATQLPRPSDVDSVFRPLIEMGRAGHIPPGFLPGNTNGDVVLPAPAELGWWNRNAGDVVTNSGGVLLRRVRNVFRRPIGAPPPPLPDTSYPIDVMSRTVIIPQMPDPESVEEGIALFEATQQEEIQATQAYEARQKTLLPEDDEMRAAFQQAQTEVIAAYQEEKPYIDAYLAALKKFGRPNAELVDQAMRQLHRAIADNPEFQKRGIGPHEFQILWQYHEAHTWKGSQEERQFLRFSALTQEKTYVKDTLAYRVTQLKKLGRPRSEWKPVEDLAAYVVSLYDRILSGERIHSTDELDLKAIRAIAFPFQFDFTSPEWNGPAFANVRDKMQAYEEASHLFARQSERFMETARAGFRMNRAAEKASLKREAADFKFQMVRLEKEFERLEKYVADHGGTISEDDQKHFQERLGWYEKAYEKHRKYWENYLAGNDVLARPHARNGLDKNVIYLLMNGAQWSLYELYEKYEVKNPNGKTQDPSCLSFSYASQMRLMDEAYQKDEVNAEGIEAFFRFILNCGDELFQELGISLPKTSLTLGGRKVYDNNYIDQIAGLCGAASHKEEDVSVIIHGLGALMYLVAEQPAHSAAVNMAGAQAVFPESYRAFEDLLRKALFARANHSGITEFYDTLILTMLGVILPQLAQGGAAEAPVFKEYLEQRAIVVKRDEGSESANYKIIQFLLSLMPILSYTAGTRGVSPRGGHAFTDYAKDPSQLFAWRIVTDGETTGQDAKIMLSQRLAGKTGKDILIFNLVHDGSRRLPEPTWFLSGSSADKLKGNLTPYTTLNFGPRRAPHHMAFGQMLSSAAYRTADEWQALPGYKKEFFTHADGRPFSEREAYIMGLQLNAAVMTADMRTTAARIDLSAIPEVSEKQKAEQERLKTLTPEERRAESQDSMDAYLKTRQGLIDAAHRFDPNTELSPHLRSIADSVANQTTTLVTKGKGKNVKKSEKPPPPATLSKVESDALEDKFSTTKAVALLGSNFNFGPEATPYLIEAVQRGYVLGQRCWEESSAGIALDGDKILWDHFFSPTLGQVLDIIDGELVARAGGPEGNGTLTEVVNINPLWVAFIKGYKKAYGRAPALFSSTMTPRLVKMAGHVDTTPLIRTFFEDLLNQPNLTSEKAQALLTDQALQDNPRIITRRKIAEKIDELMTRFAANDYQLEVGAGESAVFTEVEKQDILEILRTGGDAHLKLRSLFEYDMIVDDRPENATAAANHTGVRVYEVEPWTSSPVRLYATGSVQTDINQRLNQARNGGALEVMRDMTDPNPMARHIVYKRENRPGKIPGLKDEAITIGYDLATVREHYVAPEKEAQACVSLALQALEERAFEQRLRHRHLREQIIGAFQCEANVEGIPAIRLKNALAILNPDALNKKGEPVELVSDAHFEMVEWVILAMARQNRGDLLETLTELRDRSAIEMYEAVVPAKRRDDSLKTAMRVGNKAGKIIFREIPKALGAGALMLQHILGDELKGEVKDWRQWGRHPYDNFLLAALGRSMEGDPLPLMDKIMPNWEWSAYGVATERLFTRMAISALSTFEEESSGVGEPMRQELQTNKADIKEKIREVAKHLRTLVTTGGRLYAAFRELFDSLKGVKEEVVDLVTGPFGKSLLDWVRSGIDKRLTLAEEYRQEQADVLPKDPNTRVGYLALQGLQNALGKESVVGQLLEIAKRRLLEVGLEEALSEAMDLKSFYKAVKNDRDAKTIANFINVGQLDRATRILNLKAGLFKELKGNGQAEKDYLNLCRAIYIHTHERFRGNLKELFHTAYGNVFETTPKQGPAITQMPRRSIVPAGTNGNPVPSAHPLVEFAPPPDSGPKASSSLDLPPDNLVTVNFGHTDFLENPHHGSAALDRAESWHDDTVGTPRPATSPKDHFAARRRQVALHTAYRFAAPRMGLGMARTLQFRPLR